MESSTVGLVLLLLTGLVVQLAAISIAVIVRLRRVQPKLQRLEVEGSELRQRVAQLEQENQLLTPYRAIVDVEQYILQRKAQSEQHFTHLQAEGQRVLQAAREQAWVTASEAQRKALEGHRSVEAAREESAAIIAEAQRNASMITAQAKDEASSAAREARRLQDVITALINQVRGYGNQFVLPTAGLLDELADEFGFDEAGQELKKARSATRALVKANRAASCDYVESNRAETAVAFVLDAFNGKVDTILADIRHDNYGTLQQKIRDAYALVNQLGTAFRNARVSPGYLEVRLMELKWGTAVQELKARQREQQRLLKEKIREEERAQREFERAQREALKEEETLAKALDKARKELEQAGAEQRAKYEQKLRELTERLQAAEERHQRALSMAQQTKAGHVYIISNVGSFGEDVFKIGMTRRLEPLDRVRELGDASVPFEFDVHALISVQDAPALETALHRAFLRKQVNKVNARKEFFKVQLGDIRKEVERLGVSAVWTIEAECRQFKETQAIERAMAANAFDEGAWTQAQLREHEAEIQNEVALEVAQ